MDPRTLSAPELVSLLEARDIRLAVDGDRLHYDAAAGALTPELREALLALRDQVSSLVRTKTSTDEPSAIPRVPRDGDLALSFAQKRLWFLDRYEPGASTYNIPAIFTLRGTLRIDALERSVREVVARHEALRTVFPDTGGETSQCIVSAVEVPITIVDVADTDDPKREARRRIEQEAHRPFDLSSGPLVRVMLVRESAEEHVLLIVVHHIVCDGWSLGVLCHELGELYNAAVAGRPSSLEPLPIQYADYSTWQRRWLESGVLARQLPYWTQRLGGSLPVLQLPADRARPPVQTFRGKDLSIVLPASLKRSLQELSRREGVTLFMTLLAAFKVLLFRYTGQSDLLVGTPIANRTRQETETLIGFLVNTLVLRTSLDGDPTVRELLQRVRETALGAYEHQDVPFEKLVEELQPQRNVSYSPLFQALFVLQNAPLAPLTLSGLDPAPLEYPGGCAKFDLTLFTEDVPEGLKVIAEYNVDLFDESTVTRLLGHYRALLEAMAGGQEQRISQLPMLTPAERRQMDDWNATARPIDERLTLHALFEQQADRTPAATAVEFGGASLTYADLNARANQVAHRLHSMGLGPESRVGICLTRSLEMVVTVLGVLKAGAAYVPLDPAYPMQRLEYMLADSGVAALVTTASLRSALPAHDAPVLDIADWASFAQEDTANLTPATGPDSLMYVTYTSGSTGKPKGIAMVQRALLNLLSWMLRTTSLPPGARTLQFASLSFDVSFQDMFSTWLSGGTLVMISEAERKDIGGLARLLGARRIDRLFIPAVALQQLAEGFCAEPSLTAPLKKVIAGSEQLMISDAIREMFRRLPGCTLHNEYGPSEAHVVTELALGPCPADWVARAPIGRPIDNAQIYIVDRAMNPLPIGVPGEIYIGGAGLARGYLGRPDLTAERFVPNPFGEGRLYRTGDLARYLREGVIEFLGRMDHQTKIRGYRIEPAEVEAALEQHAMVKEAIVVPWAFSASDTRLVAYLVIDREGAPSVSALRAFLLEQLPEYMVPSAFVLLDALPLTPNGKVDRKALPAPDTARPSLDVTFAEPESPLERTIADLWREALKVDRIGLHDNFFDLGGHSLLVVRLQNRLKETLQQDISVVDLFRYPTVHTLAAHLTRPVTSGLSDVRERARRQQQVRFGPSPRRPALAPASAKATADRRPSEPVR